METIEGKVNTAVRNSINKWVGNFLASTFPNITPNMWTAIGFFAALVSSVFIVFWLGLFWGAFTMFASSLFDLADGGVAEAKNNRTNFGGFLDDATDRFHEGFHLIAIYLLQPSLTILIAGLSSFLVSYLKASGARWGFELSSGTVTGRSGRIVLLCLIMLASRWLPISLSLWLIVLLNLFTVVKRLIEVKRLNEVKKQSG